MLSGDTSLMNGNSDACAIVAANAVFPEPGGPAKTGGVSRVRDDERTRYNLPCNKTDTNGVRVLVLTCSTNSWPSRRID